MLICQSETTPSEQTCNILDHSTTILAHQRQTLEHIHVGLILSFSWSTKIKPITLIFQILWSMAIKIAAFPMPKSSCTTIGSGDDPRSTFTASMRPRMGPQGSLAAPVEIKNQEEKERKQAKKEGNERKRKKRKKEKKEKNEEKRKKTKEKEDNLA